jgi:hypothetical protein
VKQDLVMEGSRQLWEAVISRGRLELRSAHLLSYLGLHRTFELGTALEASAGRA